MCSREKEGIVPGKVVAIAGIDTGVGKTVAAGLLARSLRETGRSVITQKLVQTGDSGVSADILRHREIMGIPLQDVDRDGTTCPYVFGYPASPHLAAAKEKQVVEAAVIDDATRRLQEKYDIVLLEGAGGLLVPLNRELLLADYLQERSYPLILVSSSRLGSINHTLLSIEACRKRGLQLKGLLYNRAGGNDNVIANDTLVILRGFLEWYGYNCPVVELPDIRKCNQGLMSGDVSKIFHES